MVGTIQRGTDQIAQRGDKIPCSSTRSFIIRLTITVYFERQVATSAARDGGNVAHCDRNPTVANQATRKAENCQAFPLHLTYFQPEHCPAAATKRRTTICQHHPHLRGSVYRSLRIG